MPVLETAHLVSADGTRIGYRTLGEGAPLVIAHGTLGTSDDYIPVAVRLAPSHRVVLVDRRGYRGSEVGPEPATFDQDAGDLTALIHLVGAPCVLFGHSAGALAALHAARAAPELISALILHEPPVLLSGPAYQPLLDRYRQLRGDGEDGAALVAFASAASAVPADVVGLWTDSPPASPQLAGVAAGVERDLEAMVALAPAFEPWRALAMPVTLLLRAGTPDGPLVESVRRLGAVLPSCRTVVVSDQERSTHLPDIDGLIETIRAAPPA